MTHIHTPADGAGDMQLDPVTPLKFSLLCSLTNPFFLFTGSPSSQFICLRVAPRGSRVCALLGWNYLAFSPNGFQSVMEAGWPRPSLEAQLLYSQRSDEEKGAAGKKFT